MTLTTRANPEDDRVDIQHPDLGLWTPAVTLLQIAGGFNTKLVQDQADLLSAIATKINQLAAIASDTTNAKNNIAAIKSLTESIQTDLAQNSLAVNNASAKVDLIYGILQQVLTAVNNNTSASTNTLSSVNLVQGKVDQANTLLAAIPQVKDAVKDSQAENVFTTRVDITTVDQQFSCALPDKTKGLTFFARKNSFGKSPGDLRYAFASGQVANATTGSYHTIYRYGIYNRAGILWTGKTLYFASSVLMSVEVQAVY